MARGDAYKIGKRCVNCGEIYIGSILDRNNICPKCKKTFEIFNKLNNEIKK